MGSKFLNALYIRVRVIRPSLCWNCVVRPFFWGNCVRVHVYTIECSYVCTYMHLYPREFTFVYTHKRKLFLSCICARLRSTTCLCSDLIKPQNVFAHKIFQHSNALWIQKLSGCTLCVRVCAYVCMCTVVTTPSFIYYLPCSLPHSLCDFSPTLPLSLPPYFPHLHVLPPSLSPSLPPSLRPSLPL